MGVSRLDLDFLDLQGVRTVCELGAQDFGEGKAAEVWRSLGVKPTSLDIVGGSIRFDLNTGRVPFWWRKFDLVTNCGTTEHVFNQANAFRVIHDLCKIGGLMYHQLPIAGHAHHGFFNYNPKFFEHLARANGYEIVRAEAMGLRHSHDAPPGPEKHGSLDHLRAVYHSIDASIRILLRKTRRGFVAPLDLPD